MKKFVLPLIVMLSLIGVMAYADLQGTDQVKWSQLPNMQSPATDWSSTNNASINTMVADDWLCNSTGTIDDVHWWGSLMPGTTQPDGFQLTVYENNPASGDNNFSHPTSIALWQQAIDTGPMPGHVNVNYVSTIIYPHSKPEDVFQYYVDLAALLGPANRFYQTAGTTYFLSIQGLYTDPVGTGDSANVWGWHESVAQNIDDAVWRLNTTDAWTPATRNSKGIDMAFELSQIGAPVPEPGTLALLALGLPGLVWWRRRR